MNSHDFPHDTAGLAEYLNSTTKLDSVESEVVASCWELGILASFTEVCGLATQTGVAGQSDDGRPLFSALSLRFDEIEGCEVPFVETRLGETRRVDFIVTDFYRLHHPNTLPTLAN